MIIQIGFPAKTDRPRSVRQASSIEATSIIVIVIIIIVIRIVSYGLEVVIFKRAIARISLVLLNKCMYILRYCWRKAFLLFD